jgi:hypothetical protein
MTAGRLVPIHSAILEERRKSTEEKDRGENLLAMKVTNAVTYSGAHSKRLNAVLEIACPG